jgi:hypothetical protein
MNTHRTTLGTTGLTTLFLLIGCSHDSGSRASGRMVVAPPIVVTSVRAARQVDTMNRARVRNPKPYPIGSLQPSKTVSSKRPVASNTPQPLLSQATELPPG